MKKYIFTFLLLLIPFGVSATSTNITLVCPNTADAGKNFKCEVRATTTGGTLNGIKANYSFSGVSYISFETTNYFSIYSNGVSGFAIGNTQGVPSNYLLVGYLQVKANDNLASDGIMTVGLKNLDLSDTSGAVCNASVKNASVRIKSSNNYLSSLKVSGVDFAFNKNTLNYNLTVNSPNVTIDGTKEHNGAAVTGFGNYQLNFGNNSIRINVTSETGTVRTYTLNVNRPDGRNGDNSLAGLYVSNTDIKFNGGTSYSAIVDNNITSVNISGSTSNGAATVNGFGNKNLNVGNNTFNVVVKAENGSTKTYTINVTRRNAKGGTNVLSTNTNLSSLTIDDVSFDFNKDNISYNISVKNEIDKVNIKYNTEDGKSTVTMNGSADLKEGINTIQIVVKAESDDTKTYTLSILRKSEKPISIYDDKEIINLFKDEDKIYVMINQANEKKLITKTIIDYLKANANKTVIYQIIDGNSKVLYSVTANKDIVKDENKDIDISLDTNIGNDSYISKYNETNKLMAINLNKTVNNDDITYDIYVGDKYKDDSILYLYLNNTADHELILSRGNIKVKNGFISLKYEEMNSYILSDNIMGISSTSILPYIIIISIESIAIIGGITYYIVKKKKKLVF